MDSFLDYLNSLLKDKWNELFFPYYVNLLNSFYDYNRCEVAKALNITEDKVTWTMLVNRLTLIKDGYKSAGHFEGFNDTDFNSFYDDFKELFTSFAKDNLILDDKLLAETFYYYIGVDYCKEYISGLVFVGYGEDELFPSLYSLDILTGRKGYLYHTSESNKVQINNYNSTAAILTFAQNEVMQTIINGLRPSYEKFILDDVTSYIQGLTDRFLNDIIPEPLSPYQRKNIEQLKKEYSVDNFKNLLADQMRQDYTNDLINTVAELDKTDLAKMADYFVSLTSLIKRMQPHEEEVGGPTDVAVISKGDGFVWIKRKGYFDPNLNFGYFKKYFEDYNNQADNTESAK